MIVGWQWGSASGAERGGRGAGTVSGRCMADQGRTERNKNTLRLWCLRSLAADATPCHARVERMWWRGA